MALDDRAPDRSDFHRGFWLGLALGIPAGFPAGGALKAAGYPSDELYAWWLLVGVAYAVVLIAATAIALRRGHLAFGLVVGMTSTIALAMFLVFADILVHSE